MKVDPVRYYYKDPITNIEMEFTKSEGWGWGVSFPKATTREQLRAALLCKNIPWPALSEAEKKVVDANYEGLRKACEED